MRVDTSWPLLRERHRQANLEAFTEVLEDLAADARARFAAGSRVLVPKRWDAVVRGVILARNTDTATEVALLVANALAADDYDPAVMDGWLAANARIAAESITAATREHVDEADDAEQLDQALSVVTGARAGMYAQSMVTAMAGFATRDTASKAGASAKVWKVNSTNPRSKHARMNGETVAIGERFSNRMDWPGDYDGTAEQNANCRCSMTIVA